MGVLSGLGFVGTWGKSVSKQKNSRERALGTNVVGPRDRKKAVQLHLRTMGPAPRTVLRQGLGRLNDSPTHG